VGDEWRTGGGQDTNTPPSYYPILLQPLVQVNLPGREETGGGGRVGVVILTSPALVSWFSRL